MIKYRVILLMKLMTDDFLVFPLRRELWENKVINHGETQGME